MFKVILKHLAIIFLKENGLFNKLLHNFMVDRPLPVG
jgi:hypothetical protein